MQPDTQPDRSLTYADHAEGALDVHLPREGTAATGTLVVLVHGGFWRAKYDRTHTRPMAAALRDEGHLVITPEYRRAGNGGGWPTTFDDVLEATRRAPEVARELGCQVERIVLVGHSAGGHLALWLASTPLAADLPIARVVALAPVGDLVHAWRQGVGMTALDDFLGGPLAEADPAQLLTATPPTPEVVILHGAEDVDVPPGNSAWAAQASGIDLHLLPGVEHFGLITPGSAVWPRVVEAVS